MLHKELEKRLCKKLSENKFFAESAMDLGENTSQHKSNSKPDIPKYDDPFYSASSNHGCFHFAPTISCV